MTLQTENASNTPPIYRFRLESALGNVNLRTPPVEWEEGILEFNRRLDVGGVFSMFNVDSLTFIKEGAGLLKKLWNEKEMNAECTLRIYYLKKSTLVYTEFPTSFSLLFTTYKIVKLGKNAIGVSINAEHSGSLVKFDNRRGTDVDITKTTSIGGYTIDDYADLLKRVQIPAISAFRKGIFSDDSSDNYSRTTIGTDFVYFAQVISKNDFTEGQEVPYTVGNARDKTKALYFESQETRSLDVTGTIVIDIDSIQSNCTLTVKMDIIDASSVLVPGESYVLSPVYDSTDSGTKTITIDESISVDADESIIIYALASVVPVPPLEIDFDTISCDIEISETVVDSAETTIDAFPVYETGERLAQHMMDTQYPFYSIRFGREDTPYNMDGDFYASENQLRFMSFASGLCVRGEQMTEDNNPIILSWDKWFQSVNSMYNLGYTFETIDDFLRIRVEEYAFFFEDAEVLDISSRISVFDIESEAMPELAYLNIKSGFKSYEYESVNGRGEYNTDSLRTSIVNTDTEFNNISDIRADTKGITDLLNTPVSTSGSTDEKSDNDVYAIKTQRNVAVAAIDWDAETDENIAVENNTSLFGDTGLNLYITPTRMLRRAGNRLKVALMKSLNSYLRFQTAKKSQTLETTGETYTTIENDDILVDDLDDPIYRPIKHRVEVMLTWTDIELIMANPLQRITFSSDITGWILNIKKKNNEDKGVIEIIEKYVS